MKVGEGGCPCYWIEPLGRSLRYLRRYASESECLGKWGYHNAAVLLDETEGKEPTGDRWPHDDPRWPARCECGYEFQAGDEWQLDAQGLWRVAATVDEAYVPVGHVVTLRYHRVEDDRSAPPGALWDATWLSGGYRGADGVALVARCPNGLDWTVDGEATGGGRWSRTGDPRQPETLTVQPSIAIGRQGPNYYHGFLQGGRFTPHVG